MSFLILSVRGGRAQGFRGRGRFCHAHYNVARDKTYTTIILLLQTNTKHGRTRAPVRANATKPASLFRPCHIYVQSTWKRKLLRARWNRRFRNRRFQTDDSEQTNPNRRFRAGDPEQTNPNRRFRTEDFELTIPNRRSRTDYSELFSVPERGSRYPIFILMVLKPPSSS